MDVVVVVVVVMSESSSSVLVPTCHYFVCETGLTLLLPLLLWPPYATGQAIIFLSCGFFCLLLSSVFFSSPILSRR